MGLELRGKEEMGGTESLICILLFSQKLSLVDIIKFILYFFLFH